METEIVITLAILTVTVLLLLFDVLRMDVLAILCMLALALTGILSPGESLSGFSSNAVIAMVAVMILGRGIARTGLMDRFARLILHWAGSDRAKLILLVSVAVGLLSAIIQNVGAAVLFLPAVLRISRQEKIPASELIMPIGFAAILGGNLTMVGSGSLILINDLLGDASLRAYRLFDVLPVGLALLISGIAFFHFFGRFVLPRAAPSQDKKSAQKELIEAWHLPSAIWHYTIPIGSAIIGKTAEQTGV